jgi:CRISPR-associated protein Cas5d
MIRTVSVLAEGPLACFTIPSTRVERYSYPIPTPAAVCGIVEAIYWKPEIQYQAISVALINPPRYVSIRRNELSRFGDLVNGNFVFRGTDVYRTQRTTVALADVAYVITVAITPPGADTLDYEILTCKYGGGFLNKHYSILSDRLQKGQRYHQPHFGMREYFAYLSPAPERFTPCNFSQDLGLMYYDTEYRNRARGQNESKTYYFNAQIKSGVIQFPPFWDVKAAGLSFQAVPEALTKGPLL